MISLFHTHPSSAIPIFMLLKYINAKLIMTIDILQLDRWLGVSVIRYEANLYCLQ